MLKNSFKLAAKVISCLFLSGAAQAAVYVIAHPDDDILMMGPNLINDIRQNYPTVIIVVTAGDAANGANSKRDAPEIDQNSFNNMANPYYRVRLTGREYALDMWVPSSYPRPLQREWVSLGGDLNQVERITLGNVVEYHLNLPDQVEGNGKTTLRNMFEVPSLIREDVEGLNSYNAASLRQAIRTIISTHNHNTPTLVINYQNPVEVGTDHVDHSFTGKFVQTAINEAPAYQCMWQAIYDGYSEASISTSDSSYYFPNFVAAQRAGYEQIHSVLMDQGNITPITGGAVNMGTWLSTTVPYQTSSDGTARQKGTMDQFHTAFYGKAKWTGIQSSGPCNL